MKVELLESDLDDDISWRKKELSSLYSIAFNTHNSSNLNDEDDTLYRTVVKTLYLLLYSHWEGFIKKSCKIYLSYINQKKVKTSELTNNFSALILKKSINKCYNKENQDSLSITTYLDFVMLHNDKLNTNFKVDVKVNHDFDDGFINTFSNLNFKNYKNIIESLELPLYSFLYKDSYKVSVIDVNMKEQRVESLCSMLDFDLLQYRHSIAHGGNIELNLSLEKYRILEQKILYLMDRHKLDIQEFCYKEYYKNTNSVNKAHYISENDKEVTLFFENLNKQNSINEDFLLEK